MADIHITVRLSDGTTVARIYQDTDSIQLADSTVVTAGELVAGTRLIDGSEVLSNGTEAVGGHDPAAS